MENELNLVEVNERIKHLLDELEWLSGVVQKVAQAAPETETQCRECFMATQDQISAAGMLSDVIQWWTEGTLS